MKIHVAATTSCEDGYFCLVLHWASYSTPTPCGQLIHRCNTSQEIFGCPVTNPDPLDGPASAAAAGVVVATSSIPMTTASKASDWEHRYAKATGICQVDLSAQAKLI